MQPKDSGASKGVGRSARRRARELALQGLYQWLVGGQDAAAIESHAIENEGREGADELGRKADLGHYRELLHGTIEGADDLRRQFAPYLDRSVEALSPLGTIEAVKTVSDIFAPFSGNVIEINKKLSESPELVNTDPYGEGWMIKAKISNPSDLNDLLDANAYKRLIGQ